MKNKIYAIIPAAGRSSRMGTKSRKQYMLLGGRPVIIRTLKVFEFLPLIDKIVVVIAGEDREYFENEILKKYPIKKPLIRVEGGPERQHSVYNALKALPEDTDIVVIHDAARPFVTADMVESSIEAAAEYGAAVVGMPVKETIKHVDSRDFVFLTPDRRTLWVAQTPQVFRYNIIMEAHEKARKDGFMGTDDAMLVERMGIPVKMVKGSYRNIKITTPEDITIAKQLVAEEGRFGKENLIYTGGDMRVRIGTGYDVHALADRRDLIIGGVNIPFEKGLLGHSDADVLTHAIMDALLGAAGLGDIGRHFPDTDETYRGASSIELLKIVRKMLEQAGYKIANVDSTVIAQKPKINPHISKMKKNIAGALLVEPCQVSIKATTTEGLGFIGRGEAIAAQAVALLFKE